MSGKGYIKVWDLLVRTFHWALVLFVFLAFLSGDEKNPIHIYSGYTILVIVTLRFVWGFIGSRYARFTNFIYPPNRAVQYIKGLARGAPQYYTGHNPAAGWMVLFLLIMLILVCATGHIAYTMKGKVLSAQNFTLTAYAHADDDDDGHEYNGHLKNESAENEFWEEIHEGASFTLFILILLHIAGALASSRLHRENLIKAMITGYKEKRAGHDA